MNFDLVMKRISTSVAILLFFTLPQLCCAQEYFGSWTLDWSAVLSSSGSNPMIVDSLKKIQGQQEKNPVWIMSRDSLKVFQNGSMISAAEIHWTKDDKFEIIDVRKRKNPVHYIDKIDEGLIKMRTGYSDAEIYLRRL